MKKILITLIILIYSLGLNAQFYGNGVNGNVVINTPKTIVNNYYEVTAIQMLNTLTINSLNLIPQKYLLYQSTDSNSGNWQIVEIISNKAVFHVIL